MSAPERLPAEQLAELLRQQGDACARLGSPLYAGLMAYAADDVLDGGEIASVLRGHERDRGSAALALRLFGAVHRLVLTGRAASLAPFYPSVGGFADPDAAWPAFRQVCADNIRDIRPWLDRPPQTNEIGRSAPLLGGLLHVAAMTGLPIRLAELGASAGLNQRPDLVRLTWEGSPPGAYGPASSPVVLRNAWQGSLPPVGVPLSIVERRGCDLDPVVPTTSEGQIRLASYVWPDDLERLHRLRGAVELARQVPATVVRTDAATFLRGIAPRTGTTLVVWHSVVWQYLPAETRLRVRGELDRLSHEATRAAPVAHLSLEPEDSLKAFFVRLRLWPTSEYAGHGTGDTTPAEAAPHGTGDTTLAEAAPHGTGDTTLAEAAPHGTGDTTLAEAAPHGIPVSWRA